MPTPAMVRFDDDIHNQLRDCARRERTSANHLVNQAVRRYLEDVSARDRRSEVGTRALAALRNRLESARPPITPRRGRRTQKAVNDEIRRGLVEAAACVELLAVAICPELEDARKREQPYRV